MTTAHHAHAEKAAAAEEKAAEKAAAAEEKAAKPVLLPPPLKAGDKVKLKGLDGPVLTIQDIHGQDAACHWFGTSGDYNRTSFHVDALEAFEEKPVKATGHGPHVTK